MNCEWRVRERWKKTNKGKEFMKSVKDTCVCVVISMCVSVYMPM